MEDSPFNTLKSKREKRRGLAFTPRTIPAAVDFAAGGRRLSLPPDSGSSAAQGSTLACPREMDLEDPAQFDALLRARASATKDIVITILGPTTGSRAVRMGELGQGMLRNMVANLAQLGVRNYLAITTHLHLPTHAENNLCSSLLRPAGVCCGFAGVGMRLVGGGNPGRRWTVDETHPYMLFLQRWWFTGQAVARGYNVLSLDTDMHIANDPLLLMRTPPYDTFSALMQLDSAWPVEGRREGQRSTDERGQHVNVVPCKAGASGAATASASRHGCPCGVVPAPLLNTGFVYVRATPDPSGAQQRIYNRSVELILSRLASQPKLSPKGEVDPHPVWSQDVVNEAAVSFSTLPAGWKESCHLKDTACQRKYRPLTSQDTKDAKRRWWLSPVSHSKWLASHLQSCEAVAAGSSPADVAASESRQQLVAWTELHLDSAHAMQPTAQPPTLAALPRATVGRMCGKRQLVDPAWLGGVPSLPRSFYEALPLRQQVTHMQAESIQIVHVPLSVGGLTRPAPQPNNHHLYHSPPPTTHPPNQQLNSATVH